MQLISFIPLALFACADSASDVSPTEAALAPAPKGPTVHVEFEGENTVVTAYPLRFDEDGNITWIGSPLAQGTVTDGLASITVPARVPARDKNPEKPNMAVSYWFFAQQLDESIPTTVLGVSSDRLMYFSGKDGKRAGWYVATPGEGKMSYASTDRIVLMDDTVRPVDALPIAGTKGKVEGEPLALGWTYEHEPVQDEGWVTNVADDFMFSLEGTPPKYVTTEDGSLYSTLTPRIFMDSDEDGTWGEADQAVGSVCVGGSPIIVTYESPVTSLSKAYDFTQSHHFTGWRAWAFMDDGLQPVGTDMTFVAHENCGAALNDVPNGDTGDTGAPD